MSKLSKCLFIFLTTVLVGACDDEGNTPNVGGDAATDGPVIDGGAGQDTGLGNMADAAMVQPPDAATMPPPASGACEQPCVKKFIQTFAQCPQTGMCTRSPASDDFATPQHTCYANGTKTSFTFSTFTLKAFKPGGGQCYAMMLTESQTLEFRDANGMLMGVIGEGPMGEVQLTCDGATINVDSCGDGLPNPANDDDDTCVEGACQAP